MPADCADFRRSKHNLVWQKSASSAGPLFLSVFICVHLWPALFSAPVFPPLWRSESDRRILHLVAKEAMDNTKPQSARAEKKKNWRSDHRARAHESAHAEAAAQETF